MEQELEAPPPADPIMSGGQPMRTPDMENIPNEESQEHVAPPPNSDPISGGQPMSVYYRKQESVSPAPSCVSTKSDQSIDHPGNFKRDPYQDPSCASPAPSCLSMKSDKSIDHPTNFKRDPYQDPSRIYYIKQESVSPAPSCVSTKSDQSIDHPGNFKRDPYQDPSCVYYRKQESVSPAPSCMSTKSDRSIDHPGNFKREVSYQDPSCVSPAPSCLSMKSDKSIDHPTNFKRDPYQNTSRVYYRKQESVSPAPSCVSTKSDWSIDHPGNFKRDPYQDPSCVSPAHSYLSMKSDKSMGMPYPHSHSWTKRESSHCSSPSDPSMMGDKSVNPAINSWILSSALRCRFCSSTLKDPVSIPCGHSYCKHCIDIHWSQPSPTGEYVCLQCEKSYASRPELSVNVAFNLTLQFLQQGGYSPAFPTLAQAGPGDVACDICSSIKLCAVKTCLTCNASYCESHVRLHYTVPALQKHTLVQVEGDTGLSQWQLGYSRMEVIKEENLHDQGYPPVSSSSPSARDTSQSMMASVSAAGQATLPSLNSPENQAQVQLHQRPSSRVMPENIPDKSRARSSKGTKRGRSPMEPISLNEGLSSQGTEPDNPEIRLLKEQSGSPVYKDVQCNSSRDQPGPPRDNACRSSDKKARKDPELSGETNKDTGCSNVQEGKKNLKKEIIKKFAPEYSPTRHITKVESEDPAAVHELSPNDIFRPLHCQGDHVQGLVLTKGNAGIGKTITVQEFALNWAQGKIYNNLTVLMSHYLLLPLTKQRSGKELLLCLGKLAFEHLEKDSFIFSEEDLQGCNITEFSELCPMILKEEVFFQRKVFKFIHPTVQEFCAAIHVYDYFIKKTKTTTKTLCSFLGEQTTLLDLLKTTINKVLERKNGHMEFFLRFLLGLTWESNRKVLSSLLMTLEEPSSETRKKILTYLKTRSKGLSPDRCSNLYQCMVEMGASLPTGGDMGQSFPPSQD